MHSCDALLYLTSSSRPHVTPFPFRFALFSPFSYHECTPALWLPTNGRLLYFVLHCRVDFIASCRPVAMEPRMMKSISPNTGGFHQNMSLPRRTLKNSGKLIQRHARYGPLRPFACGQRSRFRVGLNTHGALLAGLLDHGTIWFHC
jgi:hypothetical protein